jgi:hypothetical protein
VARLREIFTAEKQDINLFLKYQCDIAGYEERNNSSIAYIPKLISATFLRVIDFKKTKNNITILQAMNGGNGLSDEKFANICTIVGDINNNKWNTFKDVDDITIIAELLYIWLDECVKYCIYPLTIIQLFKAKNLCALQGERELSEFMLNSRNIDSFTLNVIFNHIRKTLKKYEYELMNYCAMFLKEMYPQQEHYQTEIDDYEHMCEKLAIYLLGYNIDVVYDNESNSKDNLAGDSPENIIFDSIQKTIILMDFLRCNINYGLSEEINYMNLNEEVRVQLNKTKGSQMQRGIESINNSLLNNNNINNNNNKEHNACSSNILLMDPRVSSIEHNNPKERTLFEIYQLLRKHFSMKESTNNIIALDSNICNSNLNNINNTNTNKLMSVSNSDCLLKVDRAITSNNEISNCSINNNNINQDNTNSNKLIINTNNINNSNNVQLESNIDNSSQKITSNYNLHNLQSVQQRSYNDSQEPILHLKNLHSVMKEIENENVKHSPIIINEVNEKCCNVDKLPNEITKKKKEFLSSIPKPWKKRSTFSLKHRFSLRAKTQNQEIKNNNSYCIDMGRNGLDPIEISKYQYSSFKGGTPLGISSEAHNQSSSIVAKTPFSKKIKGNFKKKNTSEKEL